MDIPYKYEVKFNNKSLYYHNDYFMALAFIALAICKEKGCYTIISYNFEHPQQIYRKVIKEL